MIFSVLQLSRAIFFTVQDHSMEDNNNLLGVLYVTHLLRTHSLYLIAADSFNCLDDCVVNSRPLLELNRSPIVTASYATYIIHSTL